MTAGQLLVIDKNCVANQIKPEMAESERPASDCNQEVSMLDKILAQTQRYSELLLEELPMESTADEAALTEEEKWEKEQARLFPSLTDGQVKPSLIKGVKWLISLWQNGVNGILEAQVGFGAIIQTLGFLAYLKGNGLHGPYMIVSSQHGDAIPDWLSGIRLFPNMKYLLYFGNQMSRAEMRKKFVHKTVGPDFPIIVTTSYMVMSDKEWLAHYKWKYVVLDESHQMKKQECELSEKLKHRPMDNKLLLVKSHSTKNLAELRSLLKFALPHELSCHEEFDSWFDFSDKEGQDQQTEVQRMAHLSKLHAILHPFLLKQMDEDIENRDPQKKGDTGYKTKVIQNSDATSPTPTCYKTKGVQNSDAISTRGSKNRAATEGARTDTKSCQEVAAEAIFETGAEGGPNMRSSLTGLEGKQVVKRQRTHDVIISPLGENNPAARVQVPRATSSELIFKALKEIPDLARADVLRAYSTLIRDDRQFESLMALPMDMRKDWLLMEIGNK